MTEWMITDKYGRLPAPMPDRDLLRAAGECLYGPRWQTDLACALGISSRYVRLIMAGRRSAPPGIWRDIVRIIDERLTELEQTKDEIETSHPSTV